jgi:hypothetical protein
LSFAACKKCGAKRRFHKLPEKLLCFLTRLPAQPLTDFLPGELVDDDLAVALE